MSKLYQALVTYGTGHAGQDEHEGIGEGMEPEVVQFATAAERDAYMQGMLRASELTEGWVDAWVSVAAGEEES